MPGDDVGQGRHVVAVAGLIDDRDLMAVLLQVRRDPEQPDGNHVVGLVRPARRVQQDDVHVSPPKSDRVVGRGERAGRLPLVTPMQLGLDQTREDRARSEQVVVGPDTVNPPTVENDNLVALFNRT